MAQVRPPQHYIPDVRCGNCAWENRVTDGAFSIPMKKPVEAIPCPTCGCKHLVLKPFARYPRRG